MPSYYQDQISSRNLMEENRPFPRMSSPPDSTASSPTPSSVESYGERDIGVHPGEKVFNFPTSSNTESGGPVTLTGLTPISPSNEVSTEHNDLHSVEQYRNPLIPNITRLGAGPPFFTYLHQPIFAMPDNEKYRKMAEKKQKRRSRGEKNVAAVMKAEEILGHKNGTEDINSILESIGEQVDEDKKPRGKKYKEKVERPKTQKKDKRKSLEDPDNSRVSDKEEEEETTPSVGKSLVNFQENIYVLTGPGGTDIKPREQLLEDTGSATSSSPQSNFTKVTSKKSRGRRGKEEVGKPSPPPAEPQNQKPLPRSRDYDRSKQEKDSSKLRGDTQEATESPAPLPEKEKFPRLEKSDFPALPGGGGEVKSLPGAWGGRGWSKASDTSPDNTEPSVLPSDNVMEVQPSQPSPPACDEVSAVIVPSVPSVPSSEEEEEEEGLVCEDPSSDKNNNNPTCDEKVSVVTCPEEFEKKVANKDSPVVIFSEEEGQDWTSSEFTFGFDVNEELMATATSSTSTDETTTRSTSNSTNAPITAEERRPEIFMPFHPVAPIDSVDGAILEFGVAANNMRPLIVGVPVGVPVPASSFPLYSNHIVQPFPPFSGLTYPHLSGADGATEDPAAISPESGISSSSPLSWQPECSPQLAATLSPLHSQVTESLSNWSGHLSEEETDQDSGLASCKTENRFNFVEIVNYVSATWSRVSEDNEVQVFSSRPGAV